MAVRRRDLLEIIGDHEKEIRRIKATLARAGGGGGGGVTDHGALTGLGDDDHSQYHTDGRGDARYSVLGHGHALDLDDLDDVTISAIAADEILKWNGSLWINNTLAEAGIAAVSALHTKYTDGEAVSAVGTPWVGLIAAEDHHTKYTDSEVDAIVLTHKNLASAHHSKYTDGEVDAIVLTHKNLASAHHSKYTDGEVDAIVLTHKNLASAHHSKYTDGNAVSAMGATSNSNTLRHNRYTDGEALTAMGVLTNSNTYQHNRYLDSEAVSAVGTPWVALIAAEDHHTKYTDSEAAAKILADDDYVKIAGDTMIGSLFVDAGTSTRMFVGDDWSGAHDEFNLGMGNYPRKFRVHHKQGTNQQAIDFGDAGLDDETIFGIAQSKDTGTTWYPRFKVSMAADISFHGSTGAITLLWDESDNRWEFTATPFVGANAVALTGHTIVSHDTTATGTELDTLTDGSNADSLHGHAGSGAPDLDSITDVTISAVATGEVLQKSSGDWINRTLAEAGIASTSAYLALTGGSMTGALLADYGTVGLPGVAFDGDPDTGMYRGGTNILSFSVAGGERMRLDAGGSLNVGVFGTLGMALIRNSAGTAATPTYGFQGDTDTGMYRRTTDQIGWSCGTLERLTLSATFMSPGGSVIGTPLMKVDAAGTSALPAYTFSGDTNMGWYRYSGDIIGLAGHFQMATPMSNFTEGGYATLRRRDSDGRVLELTSHPKYKSNIRDIPDEAETAIALIMGTRGRLYGEKDSPQEGTTAGLLSTEVAPYWPNAIHWNPENLTEPRSIHYEMLVVPLMAVAKNHETRILELEARITELEALDSTPAEG